MLTITSLNIVDEGYVVHAQQAAQLLTYARHGQHGEGRGVQITVVLTGNMCACSGPRRGVWIIVCGVGSMQGTRPSVSK